VKGGLMKVESRMFANRHSLPMGQYRKHFGLGFPTHTDHCDSVICRLMFRTTDKMNWRQGGRRQQDRWSISRAEVVTLTAVAHSWA
jgi:hypothetical protein